MHKTAKCALLSSQQNAEDLTENALLKIAWEFSENCEMSRWLTKKIERKEKVDEGSSDPTLTFLFRDLSAFCVQGDWKLKRCARMEEGSHTWGRGKNTHCLQHLSFNGVFPSRPATSWMDWKLRGQQQVRDIAPEQHRQGQAPPWQQGPPPPKGSAPPWNAQESTSTVPLEVLQSIVNHFFN